MSERSDEAPDNGSTKPSTTSTHESVFVSRVDPPNTAGNRSGPLIHLIDEFDDDGK